MNMKNRKYLLCVAALVLTNLVGPMVFAEDSVAKDSKIIWSCKKYSGNEKILWLVEWGSRSHIKVFDERISARYIMDGLEKRWDWGLGSSDNTYNYAITLGPDRSATYYEFKGSKDGMAKPSGFYKCAK